MISGTVSPRRQPLVRLVVRGSEGREQTVEALVDSGYNGTLTLPPALVAAMALPFRRTEYILLADGKTVDVPSYTGRILWEGIERPVRVLSSGDQPLLGMALLVGCELRIQMVDGGTIIIEPL